MTTTRVLLIAYEFAPSASPQALRWIYLCKQLVAMGHEVHVMAPDVAGHGHGLPELPDTLRVHRIYPGPFKAMLRWLATRRPSPPPQQLAAEDPARTPDSRPAVDVRPARLNWKGRLVERIQHTASFLTFPDIRGEWWRPARRALPQLLSRIRPDVVVSSHEPATSLQLGLRAKRAGYPWIADLGDPVLASYTPARWRRRAYAVERAVMHQADHVLVTTAETRDLLRSRHPGGGSVPVSILPQGFDDDTPVGPRAERSPVLDPARLELLYTGSFYHFRRPTALLDAVLRTPGVRLNVASSRVPPELEHAAAAHPERVRILGYLPHRALLDLQREADILVNLANADPCQIPGKLYEYFGAARPILHVQAGQADATGALVRRLRRGEPCAGEPEALAGLLARLRDAHGAGTLDAGYVLDRSGVEAYSWSSGARTLVGAIHQSVGHTG